MSAIICKAIKPIPPLSGDVPGVGIVRRYKLEGGRLVATDETREAYNMAELPITADVFLQAKEVDGALWIDVESERCR